MNTVELRTYFMTVLEQPADFSGLRDVELPVERLRTVVERIKNSSIDPKTLEGFWKTAPPDLLHTKGIWSALTFMQQQLNEDGMMTVQDLYGIQATQYRLLFHQWAEAIIGAAHNVPDPYEHGFSRTFNNLWFNHQYLRGYAFGFMRVFGDAIGVLPQPEKTKGFALFLLEQKPGEK